MTAWFERLSLRDRRIFLLGILVVGLALFWAYVWHPLAQSRARLAAQVANAENSLVWMQGAAAQIKRMRAAGSGDVFDRAGKSLLALADSSARESGLGTALKRVEPVNDGRVNVWLEHANFDQLAAWLETLAQRYGVVVDELSVERIEGLGLVDARIALLDAPR